MTRGSCGRPQEASARWRGRVAPQPRDVEAVQGREEPLPVAVDLDGAVGENCRQRRSSAEDLTERRPIDVHDLRGRRPVGRNGDAVSDVEPSAFVADDERHVVVPLTGPARVEEDPQHRHESVSG